MTNHEVGIILHILYVVGEESQSNRLASLKQMQVLFFLFIHGDYTSQTALQLGCYRYEPCPTEMTCAASIPGP